MQTLLDAAVQPRDTRQALRSEPMAAHEIDAHPDAGRIWATILQMREELHVCYGGREVPSLDLLGDGRLLGVSV